MSVSPPDEVLSSDPDNKATENWVLWWLTFATSLSTAKSPYNKCCSVLNLSGKLSLVESSYLVTIAKSTVSADTGIIHVVDAHQGVGILLNGPTAFGRTFSSGVRVLESNLYCMPCSKDGRGKCHRQTYQMCMKELSPEFVFDNLDQQIKNSLN